MTDQVVQLPEGCKGFDANAIIGAEDARAFYERGYRFAVRYIRRQPRHAFDVSPGEIQALHDAGLAFMPVQHVESESAWTPNAVKGSSNGNVAVEECLRLALPHGVTVWCDLEGVAGGTVVADVVAYCQQWFQSVRAAGFLPGLYIGWHCGLTPDELYHALAFQHYWGAFNLNADQIPSVRGLQMRQHVAGLHEIPHGLRYPIDTDTVQRDKLGGLPTAWAPDAWAV